MDIGGQQSLTIFVPVRTCNSIAGSYSLAQNEKSSLALLLRSVKPTTLGLIP